MKALIQRVASAKIIVNDIAIAETKKAGILALIGFGQVDLNWESPDSKLNEALDKIINLRIFPNEKGRFDLSLLDVEGELIFVPQFTLYADTSKGRRPEFFSSMPPKEASEYFNRLINLAKQKIDENKIHQGVFGADMKVHLCNDGPVTIMLEF